KMPSVSHYILNVLSEIHLHPISTLFPYTTLFRSDAGAEWLCGATSKPAAKPTWPAEYIEKTRGEKRPMASAAKRPMTPPQMPSRSEEHTSELQSLRHLVCRLQLEKKKDRRIRRLG